MGNLFGSSPKPALDIKPVAKPALITSVMVGDYGVGKNALMTRFVDGSFKERVFSVIGAEFVSGVRFV